MIKCPNCGRGLKDSLNCPDCGVNADIIDSNINIKEKRIYTDQIPVIERSKGKVFLPKGRSN